MTWATSAEALDNLIKDTRRTHRWSALRKVAASIGWGIVTWQVYGLANDLSAFATMQANGPDEEKLVWAFRLTSLWAAAYSVRVASAGYKQWTDAARAQSNTPTYWVDGALTRMPRQQDWEKQTPRLVTPYAKLQDIPPGAVGFVNGLEVKDVSEVPSNHRAMTRYVLRSPAGELSLLACDSLSHFRPHGKSVAVIAYAADTTYRPLYIGNALQARAPGQSHR